MVRTVRVAALMLVVLNLVLCEAYTSAYYDNPDIETNTEEELAELSSYMANQEYIRQIHSMMNAYKAELDGRTVIKTNQIDTKYKTWKRNADLINSILALPKSMNDAGR